MANIIDYAVRFVAGSIAGRLIATKPLYRHLRCLTRYSSLHKHVHAGTSSRRQAANGSLALEDINHGFDLLHDGAAIRLIVEFQSKF
ncbi:hypothetical protein [Paraburkholderia sp. DGU8]|uniref:hypothetical protein n=1 Tax=Paraburkholderia sp. DGU8 TaxID=3161997 RepID=UPI003467123B